MKQNDIPVFEDLKLTGPDAARSLLRQELRRQAIAPWRYATEMESELPIHAGNERAMPFQREQGEGLAAAALFLWPIEGGFHISNIVPLKVRELDIASYNALLEDFVTRVAQPAASASGFQIETSATRQSLKDWLSPDAGDALQRFSACANKSTGSAHPFDRERWFDFLVAVHRDGRKISTDYLIRWLVEVEGWADDQAHDLAIEYEFGLALLNSYDQR